jgi:hypothetical protein
MLGLNSFGIIAAQAPVIVSLWVAGLSSFKDHINLVAQYTVTPEKTPTARGIATNLHVWMLRPLLTALAAAATLWRARTVSFTAAFCIGIAGSLFVSPQSYAHDCSMLLLPVLYFLFNGSPFQRLISALWLVPAAPLAFHPGRSTPPPGSAVAIFRDSHYCSKSGWT